MTLCYLALGSNLGSPRRQLQQAIASLRHLPRTCIQSQSHTYLTKPLGVRAQPDFLNMVIAIHTNLSPHKLLYCCKNIEKKHRRVHKITWGPRTLDIDILLFGQSEITSPRLTIPHPELLNRDFVLLPLFEIAPLLSLPTGECIADYTLHPKTWVRRIMK